MTSISAYKFIINEFLFADDLKKAENKLKQCQCSSDIASEIEQLPEKRRIILSYMVTLNLSKKNYSLKCLLSKCSSLL